MRKIQSEVTCLNLIQDGAGEAFEKKKTQK